MLLLSEHCSDICFGLAYVESVLPVENRILDFEEVDSGLLLTLLLYMSICISAASNEQFCERRHCNFASLENWISISDCQHKEE